VIIWKRYRGKGKGISDIINSPTIEHVLLVNSLKYSINQLSDMGNKVIFYSLYYLVISIIDNKMFFIGKRLENTYVININDIDYDL
jgi:hypothetical protein